MGSTVPSDDLRAEARSRDVHPAIIRSAALPRAKGKGRRENWDFGSWEFGSWEFVYLPVGRWDLGFDSFSAGSSLPGSFSRGTSGGSGSIMRVGRRAVTRPSRVNATSATRNGWRFPSTA